MIRDRDYKITMRDAGNMLKCAQGWKAEKLRSQLQFEARDTPNSFNFLFETITNETLCQINIYGMFKD